MNLLTQIPASCLEVIIHFHADEYFISKSVGFSGMSVADLSSTEILWRNRRWKSYMLVSAEIARGVGTDQPERLPAVPSPKMTLVTLSYVYSKH